MRMMLAVAVLAFVTAARADDARDIVEKAIKAGGGEKLAKLPAETFKGKGKFYGLGEGVDYTGEWAVQLPSKTRVQIELEFMGMKLAVVRVNNGDKMWLKLGDSVEEITAKDQVDEEKESLNHNLVSSLLPLKSKDYELSVTGDSKVEGKPAVGVKVSTKGHRDITLYFDKASGHLVKTVMQVKDVMANMELTQETLFSNYKDVDGITRPMKTVIKRDGKPFIDVEATEVKRLEKLDDAKFEKP